MNGKLKVAAFTVKATVAQSARWKKAAEAEGHAAVGTWLAEAADAHVDALARGGRPLPLAWRRGASFAVVLEGGERVTVKGHVSPPFGIFHGNPAAPNPLAWRQFCLVFVPGGRIIASLRSFAQCRALAADLSRVWVRWGGEEPAEDAGPVVERHHRESA